MANRAPLANEEWYHCYTRGVDKRKTFQTPSDYRRFLQLLYLANSAEPIHRSDILYSTDKEIFQKKKGDALVAIGAYCLMPNHFHILVQQVTDDGVSRFMQKLGIAYTMYFNIKNERVGNLFVRPFRSRHIGDDGYLRRVTQYIHLNPTELYYPSGVAERALRTRVLEQKLKRYEFSSLPDYYDVKRPERSVLDNEAHDLISDDLPKLSSLLQEAAEYWRETVYSRHVKITS